MIIRNNAIGRIPVSYPWEADLDLPLTTSLIPKKWFGSITYTRASIATVTDNEWVIRNCISGEARFQWARRVRNLFSYSQGFTNVAWTASASTVALHTETINGLPTYKLSEDTTTAAHRLNQAITFVTGTTYIASYYVKQWTLTYAQIYLSGVSNDYANFDIANGTVTAGTAGAGSITALSNGWYRISLKFLTTAGGSNVVNLVTITSGSAARASPYLWTGAYFYATAAQIEDVTGQSIQTAWEYVSTNVLSSPFHGAMVDWVKYFDTDLSGTKIPTSILKGVLQEWTSTNLIIQSNNFTTTWAKSAAQLVLTPNAAIWPDGAMSMWKMSPGSPSALQGVLITATVTATVHSYTVYAKAWENSVLQLLSAWAMSNGYVNFDLSDGTIGASSLWTWTMENVGNGIYRCTAVTNTLVAWANAVYISQAPTRTTGRAGATVWDWVSWLYIYGAQLEVWTFASTYIPTTTVTVTRNVDVLSYNVANVISNYGATYLELTMWQVPSTWVDRRALQLSGNNNNRFQISSTWVGSNISLLNVWNGSAVLSTNLWVTMATWTYSKIAWKWTNSWVANLFQNGSKSTDIASPQVTATQIDIWNAGTVPLYWFVKNLKIWKVPPTDAELQAITTL